MAKQKETGELYRGEVTFCKFIKKAEKSLKKHKIAYDYADGVFTLYAEVHGSEYFKELVIHVDDNCYVLDNSDYTNEMYAATYADFEEVINYIFYHYFDLLGKGRIQLRSDF